MKVLFFGAGAGSRGRTLRCGSFRDRDRFILIIEKLVVVIVRTGHFFQFIQKSHSGPPFYVPAAAVPLH